MIEYVQADAAVTGVLAAGTVTALAGLAAWNVLAERRRSAFSRHWHSAPGWVLSSAVVFAGDEMQAARPAITYEYSVGDEAFEGFMVNFGSESYMLPRHARRLVQRHPVGSAVQVWYDPEWPSDSVLYRYRRTTKLWLATAALTVWAAILWKDALPLLMS